MLTKEKRRKLRVVSVTKLEKKGGKGYSPPYTLVVPLSSPPQDILHLKQDTPHWKETTPPQVYTGKLCESCERVCCVHLCMRARAKVRMRACCPSDVTVTRHLGGSALRHALNPGTAIFCVKNSLPTGEAVLWPPTEVPTAHHFPLLASHRSTRPFWRREWLAGKEVSSPFFPILQRL